MNALLGRPPGATPWEFRRGFVEPAPRIERIVEHERPHLAPAAHQRLGKMRSDEAVGPGDEDFGGHSVTPKNDKIALAGDETI